MDYHVPLVADKTYHIFNRAIGTDKLFLHDSDYNTFMEKYEKYINPVVDTFAFNLLPNHFHLQVQIKSHQELYELYKESKPNKTIKEGWQPRFITQQFSNMLNGYTKRFNKKYDRMGGLFKNYLRRLEIIDDNQFTNTMFYIHKNPVHHDCCQTITDWPWSSYHDILGDNATIIQREKILEWFSGRENFIDFHKQTVFLKTAEVFDL